MTQEKCITHVHKKTFTWMSIETLFIIVKTGNKPNTYQPVNGLANCGIFTLWNITLPLKGICCSYLQKYGWISEEFC